MLSLEKHSSKLYNRPTFSKFLDISTAHRQSGPAFVMNMAAVSTSNTFVSTPSFRAFVRPTKLQWPHTSLSSMNSYRNSSTTKPTSIPALQDEAVNLQLLTTMPPEIALPQLANHGPLCHWTPTTLYSRTQPLFQLEIPGEFQSPTL